MSAHYSKLLPQNIYRRFTVLIYWSIWWRSKNNLNCILLCLFPLWICTSSKFPENPWSKKIRASSHISKPCLFHFQIYNVVFLTVFTRLYITPTKLILEVCTFWPPSLFSPTLNLCLWQLPICSLSLIFLDSTHK